MPDHGGVVHVRVVRVGVLERPAAGPQSGPAHRPVADHVEDLPLAQPGAGGVGVATPASASAWPASPVSQIGDRQGWQ